MSDLSQKSIKRERKKNFSIDEIRVLREEFEKHQEILTSKFTNTITNKRKTNLWKQITERVNSLGIDSRSLDDIKTKWKNLTSTAKSAHAEHKRERIKTGGGPPPKPVKV